MAIYQLNKDSLTPLSETRFDAEGFFERKDLQRLLRQNLEVLGEDLFLIADEFCAWADSSRRIDLLCLNPDANLVVVELKRSDDGPHMELQAIRYAAMVSPMTFQQLVEAHARYKNPNEPNMEEAKAAILQFLGWDSANEDQFGQDVQIILAASEFSKELTTSVVWLIERGLDITCVRLKPYRNAEGLILVDVQQLIPLPEVAEFQTQIGAKKQAERSNKTERHTLRFSFWKQLLEYARTRTDLHGNRSPTEDGWISGPIGRSGFLLQYIVRQQDSQVELWISLGKGKDQNLAAFNALKSKQTEIEEVFGDSLDWQELPESEGCRIRKLVAGGYRRPQEDWPMIQAAMVDAMIRLDKAVRSHVHGLRI